MKRLFAILFFVAVLTMFFLPIILFAQTNSPALTFSDGAGHNYSLPLSTQVVSAILPLLTTLAGLAWALKLVLRFLPTPKPGTVMAWVIAALKVVSAVTPEKHQADVPVSAPTDNGLSPGTVATPPPGGWPKVAEPTGKTPNGL